MAVEIERKFLVRADKWAKTVKTLKRGIIYRQGYIVRDPERVVRVRCLKDQHLKDQAYLTVKGKVKGYSRLEFEYPIPLTDAEDLLSLCHKPLVEKTRYILSYQGHSWEVDEFHGENVGLILAEIELKHEGEIFERPTWLGQEVTTDMRYYNSNLVSNPYTKWGR